MKRIMVTIEGVTPLLLHRFTDEAQMKATAGTGSVITTSNGDNPREIAEKSLYLDDDGNPVMPGPNLFRALIDAGKFHKAGKSKVTTVKSSLVPAAMSVEDLSIAIDSPADWEVDTRPVRIPATGGRILRHRPMFREWGLTFSLLLDETMFSEKLCRQIVDDAGSRIGLGDFRPDCKGPFGKFKVKHWQQEKAAA